MASLGGYEILHALKSGGMGDVLLARRRGAGGFERLVALKTIKSELRSKADLRAMFLDEARLLAQLSHPCIAQVHDFGEEADGTLFLAMEYVAGVRFTELARRDFDPAIAARAMAQVCRGLHAAHEITDLEGRPLGVVHRDVTPENLMLTFEGRVKVLDFGIALVRGRTAPVTEYGTIKGKPPYLSPEQVKNQAVDRRTDIFSAAVVLHEMLTGEPVYDGDSVYSIARAIETEDVAPPSARAGPLPDGLDHVVMVGMSRDADGRFDNALAMAEALERVANAAGGESLEAFARRALAADHERHRGFLRELLADTGPSPAIVGRASGVMTALSSDAAASPPPPAEFGPLEPAGRSTADELALLERPRRRGWLVALLVALAAAGLAAVYLAPCRGAAPERLAVAGDAGVAPAPVDAASEPVALAPADAAPPAVPVDARAPTRVARPRPRRTPDAAAPEPVARPEPITRPAPTGTAYLTVVADPFANVRIDGVDIGSTPIFKRAIPAGRHEVLLIHPDSNAVRLRRVIDLADGDRHRIEP